MRGRTRYNLHMSRADTSHKPSIHQLLDWPKLRWETDALVGPLASARHRQGVLLGRMESHGFSLRQEATLQTLTADVVTTSAIEGETLDREQVRSSLARRLGMETGALLPPDRNIEGIVEVMLDATQRYGDPLTAKRLFGWHAALFPTGWSGTERITVGAWREDQQGPMRVVSGVIGRERVHFEASPAERLDEEMAAFLDWFNSDSDLDLALKAGMAHLWFVTIHPFDDGNGRIARALADMTLARLEANPCRFYSLSAQIRAERGAYYDLLERTQKGTLDCTEWLLWFLAMLDRALAGAEATLARVLAKARFWEDVRGHSLNARQQKLLNRLLDGFEGKLTSSKWAKITHCSPDTALRDIQDLVTRGILYKDPSAGGRSVHYHLKE